MIRVEKKALLIIVCLSLMSLSVNSCQATEEKEYSLKIRITTSCSIPFQTLSPIIVSFELINIGNETFSGTLTLEGKTDKHSFTSMEYQISNLTKNEVYKNSSSFSTIDEGIYFFSFWVESDDVYSTIELHQDTRLVGKGIRVEAISYFFIYSFTNFLALIGVICTVVGAIVAVATIYYKVKTPSLESKNLRSQARKDLQGSIRFFCDTWEDRECMIPHSDLRKDLVNLMKNIRELLRNEFAELSKEEIDKIRQLSKSFFRVANKHRNDDDSVWSKRVESKMEKICNALRDSADELE